MLLTVPQRRRLIADLRRDGYTPRTVIAVLLLDAVVLGLIAVRCSGCCSARSSRSTCSTPTPAISSSAFALGSQRVVSAAEHRDRRRRRHARRDASRCSARCATSSRATRSRRSRQKEGAGGSRTTAGSRSAGSLCLAAATAILLAAPKQAIVGMVCLIAALLLLLPIPLNATLALVRRAAAASRAPCRTSP